ncbi:hypothetical protein WG66_010612 [Moniliophthora roreri]|nr:hypothetical protein WG66_010612 [Moniliophthora roreri]
MRNESEFNDLNQFLDSSAAVTSRTLKHCKLDLTWIASSYLISWARAINFHKVPTWTITGAVGTFAALTSTNENSTVMPNVTRIQGLDVVWEVLEQPNIEEMIRNLDNVLSSTSWLILDGMKLRLPCVRDQKFMGLWRRKWQGFEHYFQSVGIETY